MLFIKDLEFYSDQAVIQAILPTHELVILTKFLSDRAKIVDFLPFAFFWHVSNFSYQSLAECSHDI